MVGYRPSIYKSQSSGPFYFQFLDQHSFMWNDLLELPIGFVIGVNIFEKSTHNSSELTGHLKDGLGILFDEVDNMKLILELLCY